MQVGLDLHFACVLRDCRALLWARLEKLNLGALLWARLEKLNLGALLWARLAELNLDAPFWARFTESLAASEPD